MIHRRFPLSSPVLLAVLLAACTSAPARPHATLTSGAEPLRSAFNRDIGKTRIVMVAAPT